MAGQRYFGEDVEDGEVCGICGAESDECECEWDYTGGYSRADLLFGGNW